MKGDHNVVVNEYQRPVWTYKCRLNRDLTNRSRRAIEYFRGDYEGFAFFTPQNRRRVDDFSVNSGGYPEGVSFESITNANNILGAVICK
jgi:hypothetical protein